MYRRLRPMAAGFFALLCLFLFGCSAGPAVPAGPVAGGSSGGSTPEASPPPASSSEDSIPAPSGEESQAALTFSRETPIILLDHTDAAVLDLHTGTFSNAHFRYLVEPGSAVYRMEFAYKQNGQYVQNNNLFHYYYNFDTQQVSLRLTMDELTQVGLESLYETLDAYSTLTFGLRFELSFRGETLTTDYLDVQVQVLPFLLNTEALSGQPSRSLFTRAQEPKGSLPLTPQEEAPAIQLTGMFLPELPVDRFEYTVNGQPDDGLFTLKTQAGGIQLAFNRPLAQVEPGEYRVNATVVYRTPSGGEAPCQFTHIVTVEEYLPERTPLQKRLVLTDQAGVPVDSPQAGESYLLWAALTLADGRELQLPLTSLQSLRIQDTNGHLVAVEEWDAFEARSTNRYAVSASGGRVLLTPLEAGSYQLHGSFHSTEVNPLDENIGGILQVD